MAIPNGFLTEGHLVVNACIRKKIINKEKKFLTKDLKK